MSITKKFLSSLILTGFSLTTIILPYPGNANQQIKIIKKDVPENFYFSTKNPVPENEKRYCLDLLNYLVNLLQHKNYDDLTQEEKQKLEEIRVAFYVSTICHSRLLPNLVEKVKVEDITKKYTLKENEKPEKIIFIIDDETRRTLEDYFLDDLKIIEDALPECKNSKDIEEKMKFISGNKNYYFNLMNFGLLTFMPLTSYLIFKIKYPDKVKLLKVEENAFDRKFGNQRQYYKLKNLKEQVDKNKIRIPLCTISCSTGVSCPFAHLEASYDDIYIEKNKPTETTEKIKEPIEKDEPIVPTKIIYYSGLYYKHPNSGIYDFVQKDVKAKRITNHKEIYERMKKVIIWMEKNIFRTL